MREYSTNLKQIDGGKTVLSGDISSTFGYQLLDEDLKILNLISGIGTLSIINKDDNLCYVRENITVTDGELSFKLPILKESLYQIFIEIDGYKFPSNGSTFIYVEKNPDEIIMETIPPLTLSDYLTEYAKTTDLPDLSEYVKNVDLPTLTDYALKTDVPSVVGLATEVFVNEQISGLTAPDLSGLATEVYVNEQISLIPSVDTSRFLTKPLSEPIELSDPVTKNYVDSALLGVGGGTSEEWVILSQGTTAAVTLYLKTWLVYNNYKKIKLKYSFNSDAQSFDAYYNFGFRGENSSIYPITSQTTEVSIKRLHTTVGLRPVTYKAGCGIFEIDFQMVNDDLNMSLLSIFQACKVNVKLMLDTSSQILDKVTTGSPLINYSPNYSTIISLDSSSDRVNFLINNIIGAGAYPGNSNWTVLGSNG